jgi:hypothetical protein
MREDCALLDLPACCILFSLFHSYFSESQNIPFQGHWVTFLLCSGGCVSASWSTVGLFQLVPLIPSKPL